MNAAAEEGVEIKTKVSRNFAKISRSLKNRDREMATRVTKNESKKELRIKTTKDL
jgi:hypothetical protein